jgi:uncharacterized protein (DUF4415 family)
MNAEDSNKSSKTNWAKVEAMSDEEIDTSDIAPLNESFFSSARLRAPAEKVSVTIDVDADVLEWFRTQGTDFQRRMNAALKIYAQAHKHSRESQPR